MGTAKNLEVYKLSYTHTREVFKLVRKYPKEMKHSLGKQFFNSTINLLSKIVSANRLQIKHNAIEEALLEVELLYTYSRLRLDFKVITIGEYQTISDRLAVISSQLHAWILWDKKNPKEMSLSS